MTINTASIATLVVEQLEIRGFHSLWAASPWVEAAAWLSLACFAFTIAWYRRNTNLYSFLALFFLSGAAAKAAPFAVVAILDNPLPFASLSIAMEAGQRAALVLVLIVLGEGTIKAGWRRLSWVVAAIIPPATLAMVLFMPEGLLPTALYSLSILLAFHGISAAIVIIIAAKGAVQLRRLTPGLAIWALARLVCVLVPLAAGQYARLAFMSDWAAPAASVADLILGLSVLIAAMMELAKPGIEETAIDDYAASVAMSAKRFIPAEFLSHLQKKEVADLRLGDHVKKDMTIFFSDIRAFTELSESLTPEESFAFINSYLSRVVPVVTEYGGFVDKYMGDGIMALFAAELGADSAVECAVEMQKKMVIYNGHRAKMNYRPISMGIGIHTGTLMLGVVGVLDRMEGTVISDAVNLSSRLQSIAKAFNIPLVISERTFMSLSDPGKYKYRFIGKVRVKGKDAPVSVFEIFDGLPEDEFESKMRSNTFFEQGMMAYYQKDFSNGVFYFKRALEDVPYDGASRFYLETCLRKAMGPRPT
ncbi:MAG: adenylate/guanylate cyclase domain-containing protein [Clostridia bacterium]